MVHKHLPYLIIFSDLLRNRLRRVFKSYIPFLLPLISIHWLKQEQELKTLSVIYPKKTRWGLRGVSIPPKRTSYFGFMRLHITRLRLRLVL